MHSILQANFYNSIGKIQGFVNKAGRQDPRFIFTVVIMESVPLGKDPGYMRIPPPDYEAAVRPGGNQQPYKLLPVTPDNPFPCPCLVPGIGTGTGTPERFKQTNPGQGAVKDKGFCIFPDFRLPAVSAAPVKKPVAPGRGSLKLEV